MVTGEIFFWQNFYSWHRRLINKPEILNDKKKSRKWLEWKQFTVNLKNVIAN